MQRILKIKSRHILDDGKTRCIADFVDDGSEREIGIEIKSGKSQIIHRMFDAIGYKVGKLDCVSFAGLTKKDMPRGYFRHLTERELVLKIQNENSMLFVYNDVFLC